MEYRQRKGTLKDGKGSERVCTDKDNWKNDGSKNFIK